MALNFYIGSYGQKKSDDDRVSIWTPFYHIGKKTKGWMFNVNLPDLLTYVLAHSQKFAGFHSRRKQFDDLIRIIRNSHHIFSEDTWSEIRLRNPWLMAPPLEKSRNHHNTCTIQIPKEIITEDDIFNIIQTSGICHDGSGQEYSAQHMIQEITIAKNHSLDMVTHVNNIEGETLECYKRLHEQVHVVEFRIGGLRISSNNSFN